MKVRQLKDTYILGCYSKKYRNSKDCKDLNKIIELSINKINNNHVSINFYLKYIAY